MPHVTIEYSANVADVVDIDELVGAVHDAVLATGVAPLDALRTRAVPRNHYAIADRHPDNRFVAVTARFGAGRTTTERSAVLEAVMDEVDLVLGQVKHSTMLSVEYQEIDPATRINRNHLRPMIAQRRNTTGAD